MRGWYCEGVSTASHNEVFQLPPCLPTSWGMRVDVCVYRERNGNDNAMREVSYLRTGVTVSADELADVWMSAFRVRNGTPPASRMMKAVGKVLSVTSFVPA